jgi:hypothetical protein
MGCRPRRDWCHWCQQRSLQQREEHVRHHHRESHGRLRMSPPKAVAAVLHARVGIKRDENRTRLGFSAVMREVVRTLGNVTMRPHTRVTFVPTQTTPHGQHKHNRRTVSNVTMTPHTRVTFVPTQTTPHGQHKHNRRTVSNVTMRPHTRVTFVPTQTTPHGQHKHNRRTLGNKTCRDPCEFTSHTPPLLT